MAQYFDQINKIEYEGADSTNPLAFKHYNANEKSLVKPWQSICVWQLATGTTSAGMVRTCSVRALLAVHG